MSRLDQQEYLCQVSETISCSNCCGLYNVSDASWDMLSSILSYRTRLFSNTPRNMDDILVFKDHIREKEPKIRPIKDFHHCPYIGFVGVTQSRVGCLLHPAAEGNKGIDFRGLSFYGGMTCNMYFCPSAHNFPVAYAKIIKAFSENWYQYGLIATEKKLVVSFFEEIERRLKHPLTLEQCRQNPITADLIREFFRLKINWPYRPKAHVYLSNYYFNDNLYPKPEIRYLSPTDSASAYHSLFQEMASEFQSQEDLKSAENCLNDLFTRICRSLE